MTTPSISATARLRLTAGCRKLIFYDGFLSAAPIRTASFTPVTGIGIAKVGHSVASTVQEVAKSKQGLLNPKHNSDTNTNKHLETNGAT